MLKGRVGKSNDRSMALIFLTPSLASLLYVLLCHRALLRTIYLHLGFWEKYEKIRIHFINYVALLRFYSCFQSLIQFWFELLPRLRKLSRAPWEGIRPQQKSYIIRRINNPERVHQP